MTKKELEDIEYHINCVEATDEGNEALECMYTDIKKMYREQCEQKLGHKPIV